jgi:hypothetical protein
MRGRLAGIATAWVSVSVFVFLLGGWPGGRVVTAADGTPNSCGCYQDGSGACLCGKKAKCGCPGECEPRGCEEKRDKALNREIEAETRKAQQAGQQFAHTRGADGANPNSPGAPKRATEDRAPSPGSRTNGSRVSAGQRRELLVLLNLYVAADRAHDNQTVAQVRRELTAGPIP